ncbi:MAG TPA: hypothetical protein VFA05_02455 [Gaiellaceae bacterium]|nr:hypothetical protein [Gaiellaceae bacterium]
MAVRAEAAPPRCRHRFPIFERRVYIRSGARLPLAEIAAQLPVRIFDGSESRL